MDNACLVKRRHINHAENMKTLDTVFQLEPCSGRLRLDMANLTGSNFPNDTKITTEDDTSIVPLEVSFISIIINFISCPFTVLLNVLVIVAVKRRPRLQSNANILLACLAVTDALAGLTVQPSFIAWKSCRLLHSSYTNEIRAFHSRSIRFLCLCSVLHLTLVTCERLIAIKFTMRYCSLVTKKTIKAAVISVWVFATVAENISDIFTIFTSTMRNILFCVTVIFCIHFIALAYFILYRETCRHRKMIKTHQRPKEDVQRFAKESKAFKTTVFVVASAMLSFIPMAVTLLMKMTVLRKGTTDSQMVLIVSILSPLVRTCGMLNSLLNPLVYCLRQREMRKFVLKVPCRQSVDPVMY